MRRIEPFEADSKDVDPRLAGTEVPAFEEAVGLGAVLAHLFGERQQTPRIDRYEVLRLIGSGGMGRVYEARDPDLERRVAIKVLHPIDGVDTERLVREGKAMARLNHPNVVGVYDVGVAGGRVFVAMELIDGMTLQQWQRAKERTWSEVLEVYLAFGRGIMAAHEARLVHCDLKPANVLIGNDGRPRVADFGIAQVGNDDGSNAGEMLLSRPSLTWRRPLSRMALEVVGTPHYMSPEQYRGQPLDERCDQFAYCTMLWEALFGHRPFHGSSLVELADKITRGAREPPSLGRKVPRWLRQACERGLAVEVDHRWPDMKTLLATLQGGRVRRWRRHAGATAVAMGAVVAVGWGGTAIHAAHVEAECQRRGDAFFDTWNPAKARDLEARLLDRSGDNGRDSATVAIAILNRHADAWSSVATNACVNHRVDGVWTADMLQRARWCLDGRRTVFESVVERLSSSRGEAISASLGLRPVDSCGDLVYLASEPVPPSESRDKVEALRRQLARIHALALVERNEDNLHEASETLADAQALGWMPAVVEARSALGQLLLADSNDSQARAEFTGAYFGARDYGSPSAAFDAAMALARIELRLQDHPGQALLWWRHARGLLRQIESGEGLRTATHAAFRASLHRVAGETEDALNRYAQAYAIRLRLLGPDHPTTIDSKLGFADVAADSQDSARAILLYREVLTQREALFGPRHPQLCSILHELALAHFRAGERGPARRLVERGLQIHRASRSPDHIRAALLKLREQLLDADEDCVGSRVAGLHSPDVATTHIGSPHPPLPASLMQH